jgi:predicted phosphodiesterase
MRYGLLSDVHANLPALRACLELLRREAVDEYVCAGDVVGYGPHPNECVELLASLPGVCVAGNHDLIAIDRLSKEGIGELAHVTLTWTRTALRAESRAWLAALPLEAAVGGIVVAHASLEDPRRYVTTDRLASEELARLGPRSSTARLLVLGHTHRPTAFGERSGRIADGAAGAFGLPAGERWLINPGAVGQSRDRAVRARVAVLDLDAGAVTFHDLPYDVDATVRDLRRCGLPPSAVHLPVRRRLVRAALKRVVSVATSRRG